MRSSQIIQFLRAAAIATLLTFSVVLLAQDREPNAVTYRTEGKLLKAVLLDLQKLTGGIPAYAAEPLASEPVFIRIQDVPYIDVLKRLAEAVDGEVELVGKQYEIRRSSKVTLDEETYRYRVKMIREAQGWVTGYLATLPTFDAQLAAKVLADVDHFLEVSKDPANTNAARQLSQRTGRDGPSGRLGREVFVAIPAEELARIPTNSRVVWSNRPTKMQKQLNPAVLKAVDRFESAQSIWRNTLGERTFSLKTLFSGVEMQSLLQGHLDEQPIAKFEDTKAHTVLVSCMNLGSKIYQLDIQIANAEGIFVATARFMSHQASYDANITRQPDPTTVTGDPRLASEPLSIPSEMLELSALARQQPRSLSVDKIPLDQSPFQRYLMQPELYDPLSLAFGRLAVGLAETNQIQLVGCVGDYANFALLRSLGEEPINLYQLLKAKAGAANTIHYTVDGDWLVVKSAVNPAEVGLESMMAYRTDRRDLGNLIKSIKREGYLSLDAQAAYALTLAPLHARFDDVALKYMAWSLGMLVTGHHRLDHLRLYGSFDPGQKRSMKLGQAIELGSMRPGQREIISRLVYSARIGEIRFTTFSRSGEKNTRQNHFYRGLGGEMTFRYGNGIPPTARVSMDDSEMIMAEATKQRAGWAETSSADLASFAQHALYHMVNSPTGDPPPDSKVDSFAVRKVRNVTVTIALDKEVILEFRIDERGPTLAKSDTLEGLPKQYLDVILDGLEKARKQYEESKKAKPPLVNPPTR